MAKHPQEFEQLYDDNVSEVFFEELELPQPDIYLGVGSGSHAQQTAGQENKGMFVICAFGQGGV